MDREDLSENEIRVLDNKIYAEESKKAEAYPYGFVPTFHRYRLTEYEKKKGRTIFVCSMADLFGSWVPDEWIEEVFAACERALQHTYLFLTKNPKRYLTLALAGKLPAKANMWYGTTATTPDENFFWGGAWHTFVSIEPILRDYSGEIGKMCDTFAQWVIIGAETGNRKDKVVPEKSWLDEIVKTCIESNITVFMKDSLVPIVGEENMFRELLWDRTTWESEKGQEWLDRYYQAIDFRDTNLYNKIRSKETKK
ncbi:DUF5131 family protein [Butyricicoccus intestinisimiae]|uniref:Phage Gp37/Gp68 family protein n=1 Tax=Butyricicoccus intestinisimiae TaxID=2841509 RepID=A0ABS6ERC2_9FIRM|nr:DUF5131 family protein [Butyricicoccus intestinisimiae]MBU5489400.1 phage Gp37/Gp68 family protein [Butyricicoccus intestinisimiae]